MNARMLPANTPNAICGGTSRAKASVSRSAERPIATIPTTRFAPSICGKLNPPAAPARKMITGIDRFVETGCLVNRARPRENTPVVIHVMKNQRLDSSGVRSS